jgi:hypothetical protein
MPWRANRIRLAAVAGQHGLTNAAYGLLPAFKELLSWSRLYPHMRLAASHET